MVAMANRKVNEKSKGAQKRQMLIYLPEETVTAVKIAGVEDRTPVSAIAEEAINAWLLRRQKKIERKIKPALTTREGL